jgi:hypothetical protein
MVAQRGTGLGLKRAQLDQQPAERALAGDPPRQAQVRQVAGVAGKRRPA